MPRQCVGASEYEVFAARINLQLQTILSQIQSLVNRISILESTDSSVSINEVQSQLIDSKRLLQAAIALMEELKLTPTPDEALTEIAILKSQVTNLTQQLIAIAKLIDDAFIDTGDVTTADISLLQQQLDSLKTTVSNLQAEIAGIVIAPTDHGALTGLLDDDHPLYLTHGRHDALPADNPHSVTFTQASAADPGTDITAAEAEALTNGSDVSSLHTHDNRYYTQTEIDASGYPIQSVTEIGESGDQISGSVILQEGSNISITRSGQTISISSIASAGIAGVSVLETDAFPSGVVTELAFDPGTLTILGSRATVDLDPIYYTKAQVDASGINNSANFYGVNWVDLTDTGNTTLHIHDSRYYTETEINASGINNSANFYGTSWTDLTDSGPTILHKHDHGELDGLSDDDHLQYHTDARGDIRYYTKTQVDASGINNSANFYGINWSDLTDTGNTTLHIHDSRYYTEAEITASGFLTSLPTHTHDDRYYTEIQIDASGFPTEAFKYIAIQGGNTLTAGNRADTFTLIPGSNITIDGNIATNEVTITSTATGGSGTGAAGVIVKEVDTVPSGTATEIVFPNTSLTSLGGGVYQVDFALETHLHNDLYYTQSEIDVSGFLTSLPVHIHDDRYYTEVEINASGINNSSNFYGVNWTDLTDTGETSLHIHDNRYYTQTEVDASGFLTSLPSHNHNTLYYTKTESDASGFLTTSSVLDSLFDVTVPTPASGQILTYNNTSGKWEAQNSPSAGTMDHGALTGLLDDDHPQYITQTELTASGYINDLEGYVTYIDASGSILPDTDRTHSLGTTNKGWHSFWLGGALLWYWAQGKGLQPKEAKIESEDSGLDLHLTSPTGGDGSSYIRLANTSPRMNIRLGGTVGGVIAPETSGNISLGENNLAWSSGNIDHQYAHDFHFRNSTQDTFGNTSLGSHFTNHPGGVTDHGVLTGLGDDDHPQYVSQTELDASGFLNSLPTHNHNTLYYSKTEIDASGINNSANFYGTNWTDLTDGGNTTLHLHDLYLTENEYQTLIGASGFFNSAGDIDHGGLIGLADDDHPQYLNQSRYDSNIGASGFLTSITGQDHGVLSGLSDDDHVQYHTDGRGDVRYYTKTQLDASGINNAANFYGTNWSDLTDAGATTLHKHDHGSLDGLGDDDHPQYLTQSEINASGYINSLAGYVTYIDASGDILPKTDAAFDLGSSTKNWNKLWARQMSLADNDTMPTQRSLYIQRSANIGSNMEGIVVDIDNDSGSPYSTTGISSTVDGTGAPGVTIAILGTVAGAGSNNSSNAAGYFNAAVANYLCKGIYAAGYCGGVASEYGISVHAVRPQGGIGSEHYARAFGIFSSADVGVVGKIETWYNYGPIQGTDYYYYPTFAVDNTTGTVNIRGVAAEVDGYEERIQLSGTTAKVTASGILPWSDNASDVGAAATRWKNGYFVNIPGFVKQSEIDASGFAQFSFKTIQVAGQSDVVADSNIDTLTLAAGSNVTLTTNAGTDTITIASTGGTGGISGVGVSEIDTVPSGTVTSLLFPNGTVAINTPQATIDLDARYYTETEINASGINNSANFFGTNWVDLTDAGASTLHKHDHGNMDGLADDDHVAYHTDARGDIRYYTKSETDASGINNSANFYGTNWSDLTDTQATTLHKHDHGGMDGLSDDDHTQYYLANATRDIGGTVTFAASGTYDIGEQTMPVSKIWAEALDIFNGVATIAKTGDVRIPNATLYCATAATAISTATGKLAVVTQSADGYVRAATIQNQTNSDSGSYKTAMFFNCSSFSGHTNYAVSFYGQSQTSTGATDKLVGGQFECQSFTANSASRPYGIGAFIQNKMGNATLAAASSIHIGIYAARPTGTQSKYLKKMGVVAYGDNAYYDGISSFRIGARATAPTSTILELDSFRATASGNLDYGGNKFTPGSATYDGSIYAEGYLEVDKTAYLDGGLAVPSGQVILGPRGSILVFDSAGGTNPNAASETPIPFASELWKDTAHFDHSGVTNNTRITIVNAGAYRCSYGVVYTNTSAVIAANVKTQLKIGGATYVTPSMSYSYSPGTTDPGASNRNSFLFSMASTGYVELVCNRAGSAGVCSTTANESFLFIERIT